MYSSELPAPVPYGVGGTPTQGGISQPVYLEFRVNSGRISVRIKAANGRNGSFYAVSLVLIVAILALIGQMLPVQRDIRVIDVLRSQQDLVMYDVAKILMAEFAHAAIDSDPLPYVPFSAPLPLLAMQEFPSPRFHPGITPGENKNTCTRYRIQRYVAQALRHRHLGNIHDGFFLAYFAVDNQIARRGSWQNPQHLATPTGRTHEPSVV